MKRNYLSVSKLQRLNPFKSTARKQCTVYPKKYAHGFCFAVLCCGYTLTDFPISIRLTSLALWQSNDCPSASEAILMNMDKYFMWIHYERLHNHKKAKHNKTVCIFLGIYCTCHCLSPCIKFDFVVDMLQSCSFTRILGHCCYPAFNMHELVLIRTKILMDCLPKSIQGICP